VGFILLDPCHSQSDTVGLQPSSSRAEIRAARVSSFPRPPVDVLAFSVFSQPLVAPLNPYERVEGRVSTWAKVQLKGMDTAILSFRRYRVILVCFVQLFQCDSVVILMTDPKSREISSLKEF
jgi:hypothetical protein